MSARCLPGTERHLHAAGGEPQQRSGLGRGGHRQPAGRSRVRLLHLRPRRHLRRDGQQPHGELRADRAGRRGDDADRRQDGGDDAGAADHQQRHRDRRRARPGAGQQHGIGQRRPAHARADRRCRRRWPEQRLRDEVRARSVRRSRLRPWRRPRWRRQDEPAGTAGRHAPARVRDHVPGRRRDRRVLRHAARHRQPDARSQRSC